MNSEEARKRLGPEVCARVEADAEAAPPLTFEQAAYVAAIWMADEPAAADSAA